MPNDLYDITFPSSRPIRCFSPKGTLIAEKQIGEPIRMNAMSYESAMKFAHIKGFTMWKRTPAQAHRPSRADLSPRRREDKSAVTKTPVRPKSVKVESATSRAAQSGDLSVAIKVTS